jgi:hypothetical protein
VTFEVTGLTLTIAFANPAEKAEPKKHLLACIQALYRTIGRAVPPAYLETEQHYLVHEPVGRGFDVHHLSL